jgi:hypothetical protein
VERRAGPDSRDLCRLLKGDEALALGEPQSREEVRDQLDLLRDGIIALQSLGDLGSPDANDLATRNLVALQTKYDRLNEGLGRPATGLGYSLGRHRS